MAERSQVGRPLFIPQAWQLVEACPTRAPLRLCLTYRLSLHLAFVVAMAWVTPPGLFRLWSKVEGSNRANSNGSNQKFIHRALLRNSYQRTGSRRDTDYEILMTIPLKTLSGGYGTDMS